MFDPILNVRPPARRGKRYATKHNLFHILGYDLSGAGNDSFADSTALTDQSFSQRNGHYIFTEDFNMLASLVVGTNASDARLSAPSINVNGYHHLWGVSRGATVPSPVVIEDLRDMPLAMPKYEEIAVQLSDNVAGAQHVDAFLIVAPPGWNQNLPQGGRRLTLKFTATVNAGAFSWAGLTPIVFELTPKGGWYTVVGIDAVGTNLLAFQINFPRMPFVNGRKLYPGMWGLNAIGNYPTYYNRDWLGAWGTFHTFELPQIQAAGNVAGNISITGYMDVIFHGDNPPAGSVSMGTP